MSNRGIGFILFLTGLGATYRVHLVGQIGVSEIFIFLVAPFLYIEDFSELKRDGFLTIIVLTILTMLGSIISGLWNSTPLVDIIRGFASPYALFAEIVFFHHYLKRSSEALKWLAVGIGISFLTTYLLHGGVISTEFGSESSSSLGSVSRLYALMPLLLCPIAGWYMKIPLAYSVFMPLLLGGVALFSSVSGRSTAIISLVVSILGWIGHKDVRKMRVISKHFVTFGCIVLLSLVAFKFSYNALAESGKLGEKAYLKYKTQTKQGSGVVGLLMGGRSEVFISAMACIDSPLFGLGPWAYDKQGYTEQFLDKYGNIEDYVRYIKSASRAEARIIPAHSHIMGFWLWYGIVGLVFWLYVFYLMYIVFRKYISAIPEYYGYISVWCPWATWGILFSPFSERVTMSALLTVLLFIVSQGRLNDKLDYHTRIVYNKGY